MLTKLEVSCRSMLAKSMTGHLCAGMTRVFKWQGIVPQSRGQPLHPIQV
jgi:hypothetical protein